MNNYIKNSTQSPNCVLYHDKDSLLRDIIWSSITNNPYYKGAELWDNLAMSTIECDNIFDLQVALRKEIGTYLNM